MCPNKKSARKQARQEDPFPLRYFEKMDEFEQLIDASPVAIVVSSGPDEHVDWMNDRFTRLFGYTIDDMPDVAHWWPLAYPDENYREKIQAEWQQKVKLAIRKKNMIEPMEATVTCKDGSLRYIEFRMSSIGEKHLITFIDLTERRRAEEALHEQERLSQSLLRLSRNLEQARSYQEVLQAAHNEIKAVIGYQSLWVYIFSEDREFARVLVADRSIEEKLLTVEGISTLRIKGDRMLEEIAEAHEIIIVEDARVDERTDKEIVEYLGNRTIVNVPIFLSDRHLGTIGTGTFGDEGVRPPTGPEQGYLLALSSHMAVTLDRIQLLNQRRQTEAALRESEEKYRLLYEHAGIGIGYYKPSGEIISYNQMAASHMGGKPEDYNGKSIYELFSKQDADIYMDRIRCSLTSEAVTEYEDYLDLPSGKKWFQSLFAKISDSQGSIAGVQIISQDITERKRSEEAVHRLNRELRAISNCNQTLMRAVDERALLNDICRIVCEEAGYVLAWVGYVEHDEARSIRPVSWAGPENDFISDIQLSWADNTENRTGSAAIAIQDGEIVYVQNIAADPRLSPWREGLLQRGYRSSIALPLKDEKADVFGVLLIYSGEVNAFTPGESRLLEELAGDLAFGVTALRTRAKRKQVEDALWKSSQMLRLVMENMPAFVFWKDRNSVYLGCNHLFAANAGLNSPEEIIGLTDLDLPWTHSEAESYLADDRIVMETGIPKLNYEETQRTADGRFTAVRTSKIPLRNPEGQIIGVLGTFEDISERKHHEREREAIIAVSAALRQATRRGDILNVILDQLTSLFEADGAVLVLPNLQSGGFIDEMGRGFVGERMVGLSIPAGKGVCNWVIQNKRPYMTNHADQDDLFYRPDLLGDSHCIASVPLINRDLVIGAFWIARQIEITEQDLRLLNAIADIAANAIHRVILNEQTEQQLRHLLAVHQIDVAISTNFDLSVTLNVILTNVKDELEVDAASILMLDPVIHTLDYAAGLGFRTRAIEKSHVRVGDECAGRAAQEYRTVSCNDLSESRGIFSRSALLAGEAFELHYATPLIVRGQVKGVLEVFNRRPFTPDIEWISYFETLATQAAIGIESASLLENLQRSNAELMLAYDATIEGWSRALDLRDRETEGHTQRVADMALKLAERIGLTNIEKQDLWRGALLHDIGKMGVPDAILLKPGLLTDTEWEIMRQHPVYAYNMLSPISYLRHAVDISYCHHEKWDGTGYPRGLKGEEIPLAARVFCVADVFDALTSDRPYRKAWPREKVYEYIKEQSGKHFDPQVVRVFLESINPQ